MSRKEENQKQEKEENKNKAQSSDGTRTSWRGVNAPTGQSIQTKARRKTYKRHGATVAHRCTNAAGKTKRGGEQIQCNRQSRENKGSTGVGPQHADFSVSETCRGTTCFPISLLSVQP